MRSKRIQKIPQNLEGFVHSINNTKDKNKANGYMKKTDKNGSQNVSEGNLGENSIKKNRGRNMESSNDREERVMRSSGNEGDQGCLDQDSRDNSKGNDDGAKSNDVSDGSTMEISIEINENENEVVVLNDEMIELGCEKWKNNDEKGMDEVISNGPWLVNNKPLCVQKWRVCMILEKAKPNKLPVWVKINNVHMEAWSVKGISALASSLGKPIIMDDMTARMYAKGEGRLSFARVLIEIEAGKELKKEIEVVYKGNLFKEKEVQENVNEKTMNNAMNNADRPFTVVQNRRMNYERGKENKNYKKWNGYSEVYNRQRRKHDDVMGNTSGENNSKDNIRGGNNETNGVNVENTKAKSTVINSCGKVNLENVSNKVNEAETSTYNRFTLLNILVGENELVPPIEQRKVDEYMNKENEMSDIDNQGWSKEMEKYYKDRKELFDAAKDLEKEENVENRK
ncbi:zinc knuckle CX2CX4HX4C containing protein [Tanacetum coccineum]